MIFYRKSTNKSKITDGTDELAINPNGSLDVEFPNGAEIGITDGTDSMSINGDGSINTTTSLVSGSKIQITNGTDEADIIPANGNNGLVVINPNHICTHNSTSTPLTGGGIFTGTSVDITNYNIINVTVFSDQASATDGLSIEFSTDDVNWDSKDVFTIPSSNSKTFSFQSVGRYFRIVYTNGTTPQTVFRLQAKLMANYSKPSSHRIADTISDQDDAELMKAVLTAENEMGFVNIQATPSNNLRVTDAESTLAVAKGEVTGASSINKWGNAPDFDTADNEVYIWDGAEDGTAWEQMTYTFSTTADIDSVSSTDAGDNEEVTIIGLDSDWNEVSQNITLNGQSRVALTTNLIRVYRVYNNNGTLFAGHVIVFVNDTLTGGVPDTSTNIRAVIHPSNQQTEMAIYSIPAGKTGYLYGGYASTAGANKSSNYIINFKTRLFGKVFRTKQKVALSDAGTSFLPFTYPIPQVYPEKTDVIVTAQMLATGGTGGSISAGFSMILIDD